MCKDNIYVEIKNEIFSKPIKNERSQNSIFWGICTYNLNFDNTH